MVDERETERDTERDSETNRESGGGGCVYVMCAGEILLLPFYHVLDLVRCTLKLSNE